MSWRWTATGWRSSSLYQDQQARADRRKILPLVVNLADPSPSQGWQGLERKSLPERGKPDLTLCLALIHHIVIGANIPMRDFVGWLASLGTALVIEFVGRDDEMVADAARQQGRPVRRLYVWRISRRYFPRASTSATAGRSRVASASSISRSAAAEKRSALAAGWYVFTTTPDANFCVSARLQHDLPR